MKWRTTWSLSFAVAMSGCGAAIDEMPVEPGQEHAVEQEARTPKKLHRRNTRVGEQYIVVIDDAANGDVRELAAQLAKKYRGKVVDVYEDALRGFLVELSDEQALKLASDPQVKYIQENGTTSIAATQTSPANWGLDRVDQRNLAPTGRYIYDAASQGQGVHIYIVDTGVRTTHSEFTGRIGTGANFVAGETSVEDCHGHGTHVAGIAAGTRYGVAKKATIHSIRAQNCEGKGPDSMLVSAVNWIKKNHVKPAVVNMSVQTEDSATLPALDDAIRNSIASGIVYVVAAGNNGQDACNYSPSRVKEAIVVGNTNNADKKNGFSNYGSCIDLFAPGTGITSADFANDTATAVGSGTSMSSPLVAGAAAAYLTKNPTASTATISNYLTSQATLNKIPNLPTTDTPNRLLYLMPPAATCTFDVTPTSGTVSTVFKASWTGSDYDYFTSVSADMCWWYFNGTYRGTIGCNSSASLGTFGVGSHTLSYWVQNSRGSAICTRTFTVK